MSDDMVVFGASGFLGRHLITAAETSGSRLRAITRRPVGCTDSANVKWELGDLADPPSLVRILRAGDTVINLAFASAATATENLSAIDNLLSACTSKGVRRLVHCSTAVVAGATPAQWVDEGTVCRPMTLYERCKLEVEARVCAAVGLDAVIVRPTAIVGPGGANLVRLASDLMCGSRVANYCRRSLFGARPMHLVPVSTVTAAMLHLARLPTFGTTETFIVAADDDADNRFSSVERILRSALGLPCTRVPAVPLPRTALSLVLRARGRSDTGQERFYACDKLRRTGFTSMTLVADAVRDFSTWFRMSRV